MKRIVIIFLLLIGFSSVEAQNIVPFKLGFKLGTNYSKLKVLENVSNLDSLKNVSSNYKLGFHIGPWARLSIKKFYVQPEALFSIKNVSYDLTKIDTGATVAENVINGAKVNLYDLDIAVLFGYYLVNLPLLKVRANIGPLYTINLGGKQVGFEDVSSSLKDTDLKQLYESRQSMGYQLGAGVDVGNLTIDLYYQGSLQKLRMDLGNAGTLEQRLNLFKVSVGWSFL